MIPSNVWEFVPFAARANLMTQVRYSKLCILDCNHHTYTKADLYNVCTCTCTLVITMLHGSDFNPFFSIKKVS
jgi:hypothetical protein